MTSYYRQFVWSRRQVREMILRVLSGHVVELQPHHRHHSPGIPDFELKTPSNPSLTQQELFTFVVLDSSHIGLFGSSAPDYIPFQLRLWEQIDRADDKIAGFKNFCSFSWKQLDFNCADRDWVRHAHERNQALRIRHGKRARTLTGPNWSDEAPRVAPPYREYPAPRDWLPENLTFIDRLALGDTRAGEELRRQLDDTTEQS